MSAQPEAGRATLVCDAYWRKMVAVVRSLGRAGCAVDAADPRRLAPAALSRFCRTRSVSPDPGRDAERFGRWAAERLERGDYCLVLPGEELSCLAVSRWRAAFPRRVWAPVPPEAALVEAADKLDSAERARAAGVPVPETRPFPAGVGLPGEGSWILKPRRGAGAYGVRRVRGGDPGAADLARGLEARFGPLVLQEFVPGTRNAYGVSLAYGPDGSCRAGFVHRKLREFPASGGVSTFAESACRPDLIELARRYVEGGGGAAALRWEGVINFEFKEEAGSGSPRLIEVNPRLWGALPLAIRAGVDFPRLLWRLALGEAPAPVFEYRYGVRMRWLVYGDLAHALDRLRAGHLAWEVFRQEGEGDFLWDAEDPAPFWGSLAAWTVAPFCARGRPLFRR